MFYENIKKIVEKQLLSKRAEKKIKKDWKRCWQMAEELLS